MNIAYRNIEMLTLNLYKIENRVSFYMKHIYDNIYFCNENGDYEGFLNYKIEQLQGERNTFTFIEKDKLSNDGIRTWFQEHPDNFRLPVVDNNKLMGEYYNVETIGPALYYRIEENSFNLLPVFKTDVLSWLLEQNAKILCTDEQKEHLKKIFPVHLLMTEIGQLNMPMIDCTMPSQFRKLIGQLMDNLIPLSDLIVRLLLEKFDRFTREKDIHFLVLDGMKTSDVKNASKEESKRLNREIEEILFDDAILETICGQDYPSLAFLKKHKYDLNRISRIVHNGIHYDLVNHSEMGFNIVNGRRLTTDVPEVADAKIHIFGPCLVQGLCVVDHKTISSILQRKINETAKSRWEVVNHGLSYGKDLLNDLMYMISQVYHTGDIIVWVNGFSKKEHDYLTYLKVPVIDGKSCFIGLHEWFYNIPFHCNAQANEILANIIFDHIHENLHIRNRDINNTSYSFIKNNHLKLEIKPDAIVYSNDLQLYLDSIKSKVRDMNESIGAIVMNANPCTNGHIYLIRKALEKVDFLYVFLVEQNTGGFDYLDRQLMLSEALKEFRNVCLLPGGAILTSEISFPEYFNRNQEHQKVDVSLNNKIFGLKIAPHLHITHRFFGEENEDYVTNQLNKVAIKELPKYGITVHILPRIKVNGIAVSAKQVRRYISDNKLSEIRKLVPQSVYDVLSTLYPINQLPENILANKYYYPGKMLKYGITLNGVRFFLKVIRKQENILNAYCELLASRIYKQMNLPCTEIKMVRYDGYPALLSRDFCSGDTSFIPLASFYEEQIDYPNCNFVFSFESFLNILKRHNIDKQEVLHVFWIVRIVDYLLCNSRSAGNLGFITFRGGLKVSPIYDTPTYLKNVLDNSFKDLSFPTSQMLFNDGLDNPHEILSGNYEGIEEAKQYFVKTYNDEIFVDLPDSSEIKLLKNVVDYRYKKLFI